MKLLRTLLAIILFVPYLIIITIILFVLVFSSAIAMFGDFIQTGDVPDIEYDFDS